MTPDQYFYENNNTFGQWKDVYASKVLGKTCYDCDIHTDKGKTIRAFLSPDRKVLGQGLIIIPLKNAYYRNKKKLPLKDEVSMNQTAFENTNRSDQILSVFGIDKDNKDRKDGEFNFSFESNKHGEWYLIIERKLNGENIPQWRDFFGGEKYPRCAIGLGESFVRKYKGWSLTPPGNI